MTDPTPPKVIEFRAKGQEAVILFIHGFSGNNAKTWGEFPDLLMQSPALSGWDIVSLGYSSKLEPDLVGIWSSDAPIDKLALLFQTTVKSGLSRHKTIAILAHSMGGLVVQRALVDNAAFASTVSNLFLFGTPSNGLRKASPFSFFKPQVRDMGAGSPFITDLRTRWNANFQHPGFVLWTIAGERDEFVPSSSSLDVFPKGTQAVIPGNHLEIVKPQNAEHLGVQLVTRVLIDRAASAGPWNSASVAVESRDFYTAISLLESHAEELGEPGLVRLALAYEGVGRTQDAIKLLEAHCQNKTDAMGVLAGRLKRRWMLEERQEDFDRALQLYSDALQVSANSPDQLYYHAINVAFLQLAAGNQHARTSAQKAVEYAQQGDNVMWKRATQAEAQLMLNNIEAALGAYAQALALNPKPREVESMYKQAMWIAEIKRSHEMADHIELLFRPKVEAAGAAAAD